MVFTLVSLALLGVSSVIFSLVASRDMSGCRLLAGTFFLLAVAAVVNVIGYCSHAMWHQLFLFLLLGFAL